MKKTGVFLSVAGAAVLVGGAAIVVPNLVTSPVHASSPVTLNVATYEGQGTSLTDQMKIAKAYMKLHPNVKIHVVSIPANYSQKIQTEIAAGEAPDIFQIGDGDVSMFASKNAIIDLTPLLKKDHVNLKAYYQSVLNTGKVHGQLYTLPKDWSNIGVYYNKTMFKKAHIAFPTANTTWAQLAADAKKLTVSKGGKTVQWGIEMPGDWTRAVEPIVFAYGGSVISPNGKTYSNYLNSKKTARAIKEYASFYFDGSSPSPATVNGFQGVDLFQAQKVAMSVMGDWPNSGYKTTPKLSYGVAPLPKGPAGKANTICYSGWGISSQSQNQAAALQYLEYLAGAPGESKLTNYSLVSMPAVARKYGQYKDPTLEGFLEGVPAIKPLPDLMSPYWNSTGSGATAFQNALDKILANKSSNIQSVLNDAANSANQAATQAQEQSQ